MLIISVPPQLKQASQEEKERKANQVTALSQDFLKEADLGSVLAEQQQIMYQNQLEKDFLDQQFLANILEIINEELAAEINLLNNTSKGLLPDYKASTGVTASVDDMSVQLCRNDGSNQQCVTTPKNQSSSISQVQGSVTVNNRVNQGGNTTITLRQN
jgi:Glu-tRNA(Gln) amidotransferase subunit E-like FAD-binding protein